MRAILIDDEQKCVQSLKFDLENYCPKIEIVAECTSAKDGLKAIKTHEPDVIFLDIEMPWMNGFEMLELVDNIDFKVIFVTAYNEFAVKAFKINAIDYLLKPVDPDDLVKAVEKLQKELTNSQSDSNPKISTLLEQFKSGMNERKMVAVPTMDGFEMISIQSVLYCLADNNYTEIFLNEGRKVLIARSLKDVETMFRAGNFIRIHKSSLINPIHLKRYLKGDGGVVVMADEKELSVARSKKEELLMHLK